jgi:hypothetical protein
MNASSELEIGAIASILEKVTKVSVSFIAIVYALGLIVVSVFLSEYGFRNFGLLDLQYIVAGLWALFPAFMIAIALIFFRLSEGFFGLLITGLAWVGLFYFLGIQFSWKWLVALLLAALVVFMLYQSVSMWLGERFINLTTQRMLGIKGPVFLFLRRQILTYSLVIPFYLIFFALQVYPEIPPSLGGGAGQPVEFIVTTENHTILEATGIEVSDANLSDSVLLLLETDKEYLVIPTQDANAISLQKALISAVIYQHPDR